MPESAALRSRRPCRVQSTVSVKPRIFISYRKADSLDKARSIRSELSEAFGEDTVFLDERSIQGRDDWPNEIQDALTPAANGGTNKSRRPVRFRNSSGLSRVLLTNAKLRQTASRNRQTLLTDRSNADKSTILD